MSTDPGDALAQLDGLLDRPKQMWLLGAGISKEAGVPLMDPLTSRIPEELPSTYEQDFNTLLNRLRDDAHVEHVLTQISDLISIASSSRTRKAPFGENDQRTQSELEDLHAAIQKCIRKIIRGGYKPTNGDSPEIGTPEEPIISIDNHRAFVRALFEKRRAGKKSPNPVALFTTNYDTLLEDALALSRIPASDGFSGGAMGYWRPSAPGVNYETPFRRTEHANAKLYKLHGSIDWYSVPGDIVVRRREGAGYPDEDASRLLVYPQSTKYRTTQREPFGRLFRIFRRALAHPDEGVCVICGYGFGDQHINSEIENALGRPDNSLNLVAFVKEAVTDKDQQQGEESPKPQLPPVIDRWLSDDQRWDDRLIVVTDQGFYHQTAENKLPEGFTWNLWTFEGLTRFLQHGPEAVE